MAKKPQEPEKNKEPEKGKKKKKRRKKGGFMQSAAFKRAALVFGLPMVALLGWYSYTVYSELSRRMGYQNQSEAQNTQTIETADEKLIARARKEGFKIHDYRSCMNTVRNFTLPQGWSSPNGSLRTLVGLSVAASKDKLLQRCVYYAKAVKTMEKMSHHKRHVFLCKKSLLEAGEGDQRIYIKPDKKGRGVVENVTTDNERLTAIKPGRSTIMGQWQVYNVGDGCLIVGESGNGIFRNTGKPGK